MAKRVLLKIVLVLKISAGFFEPVETKFYMRFPLTEADLPSPEYSSPRLTMIQVGRVTLFLVLCLSHEISKEYLRLLWSKDSRRKPKSSGGGIAREEDRVSREEKTLLSLQ